MKSHRRGHEAFARKELPVVAAIVGLLALVALAWHARGGRATDRSGCIHQLSHIGLAFHLWAGDHGGAFPMRYYSTPQGYAELQVGTNYSLYFLAMSNELHLPDVVWCPADRQRHYPTNFGADFRGEHISYFTGLDASVSQPASFLCGDRNLTTDLSPPGALVNMNKGYAYWTSDIHGSKGNIVLADGSVAQMSSRQLRKALPKTGLATNWLAMP